MRAITRRRRELAPALRASIGLHAVAPLVGIAWPGSLPWCGAALVANHAVLAAAGMWPQSRLLGPNLTCLPEAAARRGCIALTFDDGPDPSVTPRLLDLLDEAKAVASFFCIGRAARAHPALVRDISRRGHSVENHTATHPYGFACFTPGRLRREIGEAQSILADITGSAPGFFRAPMGLRNPLLHLVLAETDLRFTSWTRRALDGALGSPDRALARLTRGLTAGDILLMHDGRCARAPSGREVVLEVLPAVLRAVMAAGLRPVSLPMACGEGGATAAAWLAGATAGP